MITVLQRQQVRKRTVPPVRHRERSTGVRWNAVARAAPRRRLRLRISPAWRPRRLERSQRPAQRASHPRHVARVLSAILHLARNPWLAVGLAIAFLALILVPAIGITGIPLPLAHPVIPVSAELDQELSRVLFPPEEAPKETATVNPVLLNSLKVVQYKARAGDSISSIAARYKLNLDTLISWNEIRDARSIAVGAVFDVPNSDGLKYHVRRGDSLERIARTAGIELNAILDWNRLPSSVISVGQELFLPGARMNPNELNRILGSLFMYPVRGRISSTFGERHDPFSGIMRFHNGIDIVAPRGTQVAAAMAGTVRVVGYNANFGRYVILGHTGYQTMYAHLDQALVSRGGKVQQGQKIGLLGNTGYSTGPHLHFSVFRNGEAIDPIRFLK